MIAEVDIYRAAHQLMKQHGAEAAIVAAMEADACLDAGDLNGEVLWLRIIAALEELKRTDRPPSALSH